MRESGDSVELYSIHFDELTLPASTSFIDLSFDRSTAFNQKDIDFFAVLREFRMVPAGTYRTVIELHVPGRKDEVWMRRSFVQYSDTVLSSGSGLRSRMNEVFARTESKVRSGKNQQSGKGADQQKEIARSDAKLKRSLRSVKGLNLRPVQVAGKTYSEAWYKGYLLGRYELAAATELGARARRESEQVRSNATALVNTELEGFRSIGSQLKDLNSKPKKESRMKGTLDVSTYRASSQDPQTAIDQNYTELNASLDVEVLGLPCSLEGYYTTQDQNRKAKASYLRFHYDVASAKNRLKESLDAYKGKLSETMAKGQGMEQIYGQYAKKLEQQKDNELKKMAREYEVDPELIVRHEGDADKIIKALPEDSSGNKEERVARLKEKRQKLEAHKKDISRRYEQIAELQQKAEKYHGMLEQYRSQNYLDSLGNYRRIAGLDGKDPSYKDLSKAGAGLLPDGKAKKFITGITSFDAGIINKYESQYTLSGQTMKGVSMGYDFGICETGVTLGSTEYISRQGNVDHYSTMLVRVDNKGSKDHKVGFLYNVSTPAKSMSMDDKFIGKQSVRYPGFTTPAQVASLVYEGRLGQRLSLHSELASSFKKGQETSFDMAHAAVNAGVDYLVPHTTLKLSGNWEHLGRSFENNTLPYIRSGTERYTVGGALDLFRSLVSLKVDYNLLVQENFTWSSYNRKWGFEARLRSKRYPTVSVSYKPFSTFRTLSDTLQIAQRPIQGEVWTARASYQFKRKQQVHRFTLLYNRNTSTADTIQYQSANSQLGYIYTLKDLSLSINAGRIELPANFSDGSGMVSSYTGQLSVSKGLGKYVHLSLSPDVAFCDWGRQRISGSISCVFRVPGKSISIRMMLRGSRYRLQEADPEQELYAGQMGMNWQFKAPERKNRKP